MDGDQVDQKNKALRLDDFKYHCRITIRMGNIIFDNMIIEDL